MVSSDHLKPGATGEIKGTIDTTDRFGRIEKFITIFSNDKLRPALTLSLIAEVEGKKQKP